MKITNKQLKQIIKEELRLVLNEAFGSSEQYSIKNWQDIEGKDYFVTPFKKGESVIEMYAKDDTSWIDDLIGPDNSKKIQKLFGEQTATEFFGKPSNGAAVNQFISLVQSLNQEFKGYPVGSLYLGGNTNIWGFQITYDPGSGFSFVDDSGALISPVQAESPDGRFYFEPGYTSLDSLFGYRQHDLESRGIIEVEENIRTHGYRGGSSGTQVDAVTIDFNKLMEELNNGNLAARVDENGDYHITNIGY